MDTDDGTQDDGTQDDGTQDDGTQDDGRCCECGGPLGDEELRTAAGRAVCSATCWFAARLGVRPADCAD